MKTPFDFNSNKELDDNIDFFSVAYHGQNWLDLQLSAGALASERVKFLENNKIIEPKEVHVETRVLTAKTNEQIDILAGFKLYMTDNAEYMHYLRWLGEKDAKSLLYDAEIRAKDVCEIGNFFNEQNCPKKLKTLNYIVAIIQSVIKKTVVMGGFVKDATTKKYESRLKKVLGRTIYEGKMTLHNKECEVLILYGYRWEVIANLLIAIKDELFPKSRHSV